MTTITNIEMIHACKAIDRLMEFPLRPKNSYWLMRLSNRLENSRNAYNDAELKMIEDQGLAEYLDGQILKFPNKELQKKYVESHAELDSIPVEIPDNWKISLEPDEKIRISGNDLKILRPLITFIGLEEPDEEEPANDGA